MVNIKKVINLSVAVSLVEIILIRLLSYFQINTNTIFSYLPTILFSYSTLISLLFLFIGSILIVYAGFFLYEQGYVSLWKGKNLTQRIIAILLYGHIVLFAILWFLNTQVIIKDMAIVVLINLAYLSVIVPLASNFLKWPRI